MTEFTYVGPDGTPLMCPCAICGQVGKGEPAHGWDTPCPTKITVDKAYTDKLDAERMYYIRGGSSSEAIAGSIRHMAGQDDDE